MKLSLIFVSGVIAAFVVGVVLTVLVINFSSDKRPTNPYQPATTLPQCLHTGGRIDGDRCSYPIEKWRPIAE